METVNDFPTWHADHILPKQPGHKGMRILLWLRLICTINKIVHYAWIIK